MSNPRPTTNVPTTMGKRDKLRRIKVNPEIIILIEVTFSQRRRLGKLNSSVETKQFVESRRSNSHQFIPIDVD